MYSTCIYTYEIRSASSLVCQMDRSNYSHCVCVCSPTNMCACFECLARQDKTLCSVSFKLNSKYFVMMLSDMISIHREFFFRKTGVVLLSRVFGSKVTLLLVHPRQRRGGGELGRRILALPDVRIHYTHRVLHRHARLV